MTIIIFLMDTSASMNQRTYQGMSLLDTGKVAVETFMKIRSRDPASRWDRYMLLSFEDPPSNVKAGWKESHGTFTQELKNLQAYGLSTLGPALKNTFDLLNVNRMQTGIDTYGQGRCPFFLEPAIIVCITDGKHLTKSSGVETQLNLPMDNPMPGNELTREPFRWDQRLYGLVMKFPATPPMDNGPIPYAEDTAIHCMCEVTGGRSYAISSQRQMVMCLESLVQKTQPGVVINFEKIGPDPPGVGNEENQDSNIQSNSLLSNGDPKRANTPTPSSIAWHSCRKLIFVPRSAQKGYSVGHWPIPESFWPDLNSAQLPPRSAHPEVKFSCASCEPMVIDNFPFDKYELEPSPLTQYILERRQPNVAWQVYVSNSAKYSDMGHPFGYLKASTQLGCVNLFVMPYNYPVLLPLLVTDKMMLTNYNSTWFHRALSKQHRKGWRFLTNQVHPLSHVTARNLMERDGRLDNHYRRDELLKIYKCKPTQKWRQQFDNYLKTMPVYYAGPLRRALVKVGVANLVPDQMDNCLSYTVVSYLKKLKNQAKVEYERMVSCVGQASQPVLERIKVVCKAQNSLLQRKDFNQLLTLYGGDMAHLKHELQDLNTLTLAVPDKDALSQPYKNPFDIPRKHLVEQVARMRANFLHTSSLGTKLQDEDAIHSMPVQQMGNYQEYLKRQPPALRELEVQPLRQHTFGNPFKVNKNLMIDEADEAMPGQQSKRKASSSSMDSPPGSPMPRKRKPGPLPKDFPYRRPPTPSIEIVDNHEAPDKSSPEEDLEAPAYEPLDMNHADLLIDEMTNHIDEMQREHEEQQDADFFLVHHQGSADGPTSTTTQTQQQHVRGRVNGLEKHNQSIRLKLIKEVRRPGKNYAGLFDSLGSLQGSLECRCLIIQHVINEALRFKKRVLMQQLIKYEQSLLRDDKRKQKTLANNNDGDLYHTR